MPKTRFQMTVRVSPEVRDALDRRVEACRAIGTPVERASLAAALLARAVAVDLDEVRTVAAKLDELAARLRSEPAPMKADRVKSMADAVDALGVRLWKAVGEEVSDGG